ncbi:putative ribosomal-protein-alanine acetyltransferase [Pseudoalteromonas luteoviolacea B = ATCC 29581]|nr:putative ribosomal-protein-alanine acetyltransferase [Pseudoalteromonas luteoviolacea B = ATCC 29581]
MFIETQRLQLRPIKHRDSARLMTILNEPSTQQFNDYGNQISREELKKWIQWDIASFYKQKGIRLVIIDQSKLIVGTIGLHYQAQSKGVTVSFELASNARGQGYVQEALKATQSSKELNWLNEQDWYAKIHIANVASQKIMEKLKFTRYLKRGNYIYYRSIANS